MSDEPAPTRLIVGNRIRCPKDKTLRPMHAYRTFEMSPEFEGELNPVLKCPCGHLFSLVDAGELRAKIVVEGLAGVA